HLKLAQQTDTTKFPYSTVLHPQDPTFDFMPEFREELSGYESPPPSPFHVSSALEDQTSVVTGDESHMMDFEYSGKLVDTATYDKSKKQTTLKLTGVRTIVDADLVSDGSVFKPLMGGVKGKPKATAAPAAGTGYMPTAQQETALTTTHNRR